MHGQGQLGGECCWGVGEGCEEGIVGINGGGRRIDLGL